MSRIGAQPIILKTGVSVEIEDGAIAVVGPKGTLRRKIVPEIAVALKDDRIEFHPISSSRRAPALWGLMRSLVANMAEGVISGFEKKLEFEGVGFRAALEGRTLVMQLGFSHPVRYDPPEGISLKVERAVITVSGIDKELVGLSAATIRALKKPEPYKGKGIRYQGEVIRRKAGKKGATAA